MSPPRGGGSFGFSRPPGRVNTKMINELIRVATIPSSHHFKLLPPGPSPMPVSFANSQVFVTDGKAVQAGARLIWDYFRGRINLTPSIILGALGDRHQPQDHAQAGPHPSGNSGA